jgi:tRNA-uridine 2-sulfurtransferase
MSRMRVVVGMSGGVDSSAAAALLAEQGCDVIGVTIKTAAREAPEAGDRSCCSLEGINDARLVCADLGIPHFVVDFSLQFSAQVITPFVDGYLAGRTPNPCVLCNRSIKWEELLRHARALGATHVATGHYARVRTDGAGRFWIARGADAAKDQAYALWMLSQDSLARTILPLGDMTKDEVRAHAAAHGVRTAGKGESYEICFVPDDDYAGFLRRSVPDLDARVRGGDLLRDGSRIGSHDGHPFYTIGQRRGLGIAAGEPLYVTSIDAAANTVTLGRADDLLQRACVIRDITLQKADTLRGPLRVTAKIRYRDDGASATVCPLPGGTASVVFDAPRRAITPGQSLVCYDGDDVLLGGIIDRVDTGDAPTRADAAARG